MSRPEARILKVSPPFFRVYRCFKHPQNGKIKQTSWSTFSFWKLNCILSTCLPPAVFFAHHEINWTNSELFHRCGHESTPASSSHNIIDWGCWRLHLLFLDKIWPTLLGELAKHCNERYDIYHVNWFETYFSRIVAPFWIISVLNIYLQMTSRKKKKRAAKNPCQEATKKSVTQCEISGMSF